MYQDCFAPCPDTYLLSHSVGRMPLGTEACLRECFLDPWEHGAPEPWPLWLETITRFQAALGRLFNSAAENFCPQTNISSALGKVIGGLAPRSSRKVVLFCEHDFPSVGFVLQQAVRLGYQPRMIPAQEDAQQLATWEAALTPEVHSVLLTHAHFNSGKLIPVAEVTRLSRAREIFSIVDIAQSAGVIPIDLRNWQADVVLGSCVKWLCGGPGAGFLWLEPDTAADLKPLDVGWFSHSTPFEFDINRFEYAEGSARFWGGTPSILPYVVASHSLELVARIGVETVRQHNMALTQKIASTLDPGCLRAPADPALRSGTLVLTLPNQTAAVARLREAGVRFDVRPLGLRLSPHIYNTAAEIDTVVDCLSAGDQ